MKRVIELLIIILFVFISTVLISCIPQKTSKLEQALIGNWSTGTFSADHTFTMTNDAGYIIVEAKWRVLAVNESENSITVETYDGEIPEKTKRWFRETYGEEIKQDKAKQDRRSTFVYKFNNDFKKITMYDTSGRYLGEIKFLNAAEAYEKYF